MRPSLRAGGRKRWLRPVLALAALAFAALTLLYNVLYMVALRRTPALPPIELGFDFDYVPKARAFLITRILSASPAERAGMQAGDRIVAIEGVPAANEAAIYTAYFGRKPGDRIWFTIERPGQADLVSLSGILRLRRSGPLSSQVWHDVQNAVPVPFVIIGLTVLFMRLEDRDVWLLALLFASFTTVPGLPNELRLSHSPFHSAAVAYYVVFLGLLGGLFYFFFAVFPTRSPVDRRLPWLKWAALSAGAAMALPGLRSGSMALPAAVSILLGDRLSQKVPFWYEFAFLTLGLVSLTSNFFRAQDSQARRKLRVIFAGTVVGVGPALAGAAVENFTGTGLPLWLAGLLKGLLFLFPLSFAYAVVKHRVLEIPVLLRMSARYLMVQRGFTVVLGVMSIAVTLLFAAWSGPRLQPLIEAAQPAGITLGAAFGTMLLWGGARVHRKVSGRIDRAFFRSAYDVRVVLEELAERTRTVTNRNDLARLLDEQLNAALHPVSLLILFHEAAGQLVCVSGNAPPGWERIAGAAPLLAELSAHGQAREFPVERTSGEGSLPDVLNADCLVPVPGRGGSLAGLLALGPRRSEEPYSREDRRLLESVASQAGMALESIRLAEEIAERMEQERRMALEMEIAQEVQSRLLPDTLPRLATLECAARCIQARSVGGDCYDFFDAGPGHAGFMLADVSGKGVHAALLMANLLAHVRSQSAISPRDPERLLDHVNRMMWKSTAAHHYATLFLGIYEDALARLRYVNCGHNPPMLLHRDGSLDRLEPTATVIGIFPNWRCESVDVQLHPGDLLAVFSDGVTEAAHGEAEFGEERLIQELRSHYGRPAGEIAGAILQSVQAFSNGPLSDDLTLLVGVAGPRN